MSLPIRWWTCGQYRRNRSPPGSPRRGHVVEQRVEPDVGHEPVVERERDAPLEPALRAADRQILEGLPQEAQELVPVALGLDGLRMVLEVAPEPVLVRRHPEEVVLLLDVGQRGLVVGALAVDDLLLRVEALAPEAVLPAVLAEVDLALLEEPLQDGLDHARVPRLGRPDEVVVGDPERVPLLPERLRVPVGEGLRASRRPSRPPGRSCRRARRCPSGRRRRRPRAGGSGPSCRPRSSCRRGRDGAGR